ncbi:MAG: malto-oligosyltrehalose trehalohydrolase [candidate division NC10 bacterium]
MRHDPRTAGLWAERGVRYLGDGQAQFCLWAPRCTTIEVAFVRPENASFPLQRTAEGYFIGMTSAVPGTRYMYILDGKRRRTDPVARALPVGVHGPAEIADLDAFSWTDSGWRGRPLAEMVIYELHVGTFTPEGTFDAVIPRLDRLCDLGITAIGLMPVASFPGVRNWGYDGVGLFAPQRSYGGPAGLQHLVDACHAHGVAVILDVVYNHLGPEGNYLAEFAPYFTDRYQTPWGPAMNFDGEESRAVRDFVLANALFWIRDYHIDGLRLDAVHEIFDTSPVHILRELNDAVQHLARRLGRTVPVVAESDLNDRRVIDSVRKGGYGLAGQWSDDFHHCLHTLLTGERTGYYADFGSLDQLSKAYRDGFVYDGQHSAYRGRPHGTPTRDLPGERFVVCSQNHDQVGNRALGERLGDLTDFEGIKLAATAVLLSPYVPLLFMGEEYGERSPFLFFTDFEDPALQAAVSRGRREEFAAFECQGGISDPQDAATFARSRLSWGLQDLPPHCWLRHYYRTLLAIRRMHPILGVGGKRQLTTCVTDQTLTVFRRAKDGAAAAILLHFAPNLARVAVPFPPGRWRRLLDSAEGQFGGPGAAAPLEFSTAVRDAWSFDFRGREAAVYLREANLSERPSGRPPGPTPEAAP